MKASDLAHKTLIAGIVVGAIGALATLLTTQFYDLHTDPSLSQDLLLFVSSAVSLLVYLCLPFSAALIAGYLVMRHAEILASGDRRASETNEADN